MKNMGRQVFTCLPMLIYPGKKNQKSHNNFYQFFDKESLFYWVWSEIACGIMQNIVDKLLSFLYNIKYTGV